MSRFGETHGKPSELHPKSVAKALGLRTDGPTSWASLLDAAVTAYWERRVDKPGDTTEATVDHALPLPRNPSNNSGSRATACVSNAPGTFLETGGEAA